MTYSVDMRGRVSPSFAIATDLAEPEGEATEAHERLLEHLRATGDSGGNSAMSPRMN